MASTWIRLWAASLFFAVVGLRPVCGEIPRPDDAPPPLSPEESAKCVKVPPGFHLEIVASEPLIREPSGVCWDERGRMFVCELHGFNVDGQIDIDEQNKTGELDTVVRRFFVPEHIEKAAQAETYGTVKLLTDTNGDGRMDKAEVWADRLPACFGVCPARGGVIVVCAPDIIYLADNDHDGTAEVREVLYTGFSTGVLDRRMGDPKWGMDDWIYVGRSHAPATITGPHLATPVDLPNTDFRIKPDGSAIEPVSGDVGGLGHTRTESGDRFVSSVGWPAHLVVPLPWDALARNPYVATPPLTVQVFPDRKVFPSSQPHPWRSKRAADPGFSKFYTDGWGVAESSPNGYFTSCCGPLVYQDHVLPGLHGQLLACEPAQNLIHRSIIERDGSYHRLHRATEEESTEFFTSTDQWFHPIAMSHGPDGSVWITDFYREIIEDYSAIPRYLQQQYGVTNGKDHGRIWKLAATGAAAPPPFDMSQLTDEALVAEVGSALYWRRETARRLLIERRAVGTSPQLISLLDSNSSPAVIINALHTIQALGILTPELLMPLATHSESGVRRQVIRLAESWFDQHPQLFELLLKRAEDNDPLVRLQLALSLGASQQEQVLPVLAEMARRHGQEPWLITAILTSLTERGGLMLGELLKNPDQLSQAVDLLEPLCAAIAARRDSTEFNAALVAVCGQTRADWQALCLKGFRKSFHGAIDFPLPDETSQSIKSLVKSDDPQVRREAQWIIRLLKIETPEERTTRLALGIERLADVTLPIDDRVAAVDELITEDDPQVGSAFVAALPVATPKLREVLLDAIFWRTDRLPMLLDGIEQKAVAPSLLSAVQRNLLLNHQQESIRTRASELMTATTSGLLEAFPRYASALDHPRDVVRGLQVFREVCGKCHQAHGVGIGVGPDLSSEFQRAEQTIIRDILAPSETISPGYMIYTIVTTTGQSHTGLLASESPTSVTLKQQEGKQVVVLRHDIEVMKVSPISMMPEDLVKLVSPEDVANVIAWLRSPQQKMVLLDDNESLATALDEGDGTAEFVTSDKYSGEGCLRVTPPQRYSSHISGWEFKIRERPAAGEFRYIRFAWKSPQASGAMLEFAASGQWPPPDSTERRYFAGKNLTPWQAVGIAPRPPADWVVMTRDLWADFGDFTLTGIAPTAIDGPVLFDRIELLQTIDP